MHTFLQVREDDATAKNYSKLKPHLKALYKEAITAYNHEAYILCAAGLRALIEGIVKTNASKVGISR